MSKPVRHAENWETVAQKLTEATMWMAVCVDAATDARHPRQAEFLRRWVDLQQRLGVVQADLERLAGEQQGAGFPR